MATDKGLEPSQERMVISCHQPSKRTFNQWGNDWMVVVTDLYWIFSRYVTAKHATANYAVTYHCMRQATKDVGHFLPIELTGHVTNHLLFQWPVCFSHRLCNPELCGIVQNWSKCCMLIFALFFALQVHINLMFFRYICIFLYIRLDTCTSVETSSSHLFGYLYMVPSSL